MFDTIMLLNRVLALDTSPRGPYRGSWRLWMEEEMNTLIEQGGAAHMSAPRAMDIPMLNRRSTLSTPLFEVMSWTLFNLMSKLQVRVEPATPFMPCFSQRTRRFSRGTRRFTQPRLRAGQHLRQVCRDFWHFEAAPSCLRDVAWRPIKRSLPRLQQHGISTGQLAQEHKS